VGRAHIYDSTITTINTIDLPSCLYAPPVNLDNYEFGDAVPLAEEGLGGMEAMVRKRTDVWDWWAHGLNRTIQGLFGERSEC